MATQGYDYDIMCVHVRFKCSLNAVAFCDLFLVQVIVTAALSLYVIRLAQREFNKMSQENTENSQVIVP